MIAPQTLVTVGFHIGASGDKETAFLFPFEINKLNITKEKIQETLALEIDDEAILDSFTVVELDIPLVTINNDVSKKDLIERMLIEMWRSIGMDIPDNHENIVQDCYEDVCETADPVEWHSGDVAIAFRRWIEAQGNQN